MFRFKSLTAKFIFVGIILLAFISIYIYAGFLFTHHISNAAIQINLAGRERILIKTIGSKIMHVLDIHLSHERDAHIKGVEETMAEYEEALYGLRMEAKGSG